jgi:hypothetical protein
MWPAANFWNEKPKMLVFINIQCCHCECREASSTEDFICVLMHAMVALEVVANGRKSGLLGIHTQVCQSAGFRCAD